MYIPKYFPCGQPAFGCQPALIESRKEKALLKVTRTCIALMIEINKNLRNACFTKLKYFEFVMKVKLWSNQDEKCLPFDVIACVIIFKILNLPQVS